MAARTPLPTSFAPDGARLLFHPVTMSRNIAALKLVGERRSEFLLQTSFDESNAEVSPDGRWLVYQSNESGRYEIYVRPLPNVAAGRWQVSTDGGTRPMWARNGRALFYMTGAPLTLMEVPVQAGMGFVASTPRVVLQGPNAYIAPQFGRPYDVTPDGQRFLMMKEAAVAQTGASAPQLILIQNWLEELRRLAPAN